MDQNTELDQLFERYRMAVPDPDAAAVCHATATLNRAPYRHRFWVPPLHPLADPGTAVMLLNLRPEPSCCGAPTAPLATNAEVSATLASLPDALW